MLLSTTCSYWRRWPDLSSLDCDRQQSHQHWCQQFATEYFVPRWKCHWDDWFFFFLGGGDFFSLLHPRSSIPSSVIVHGRLWWTKLGPCTSLRKKGASVASAFWRDASLTLSVFWASVASAFWRDASLTVSVFWASVASAFWRDASLTLSVFCSGAASREG